MRGVTGGVGNGSEDFGAGGLTVMGGPQLVGKPGVLGPEIDCHISGNRAHKQIHLARRPRAPGSYVDCCRAATTCRASRGLFHPKRLRTSAVLAELRQNRSDSGPWPRDLRFLGGDEL